MATAVGRLALAGRDMNKLSGFTSRVSLLMDVLNDMKKNKFVRTQVDSPKGKTINNYVEHLGGWISAI